MLVLIGRRDWVYYLRWDFDCGNQVTKAVRISRLKKALDKQWSIRVRQRDGICQMCEVPGKTLHAHHWHQQKARSLTLRWDTDNGVALCYWCHFFHVHTFSVHATLGPFFQKMTARFNVAAMDAKPALECTEENLLERLSELRYEAG